MTALLDTLLTNEDGGTDLLHSTSLQSHSGPTLLPFIVLCHMQLQMHGMTHKN